jgi:hypothetical protein
MNSPTPSPSPSETITDNTNKSSSSPMESLSGMNQWLQQQNLHPKHLAAVVQAISRNTLATDNDVSMENVSSPIKQEDSTTAGSLDDQQHTLQAMMTDSEMMRMNLDALMDVTTTQQPELDAKTGVERLKTEVNDDDDDDNASPHMSLSASKLKSAPPMSPIEALHYIRTVKNLDQEAQVLFKPSK